MPNFETFSRRMMPLKAEPHVTIQRRGTISLNRSSFAALGSPDAVELLYDRGQRIVGLRPVAARAANAYHVRPSSSAPGSPLVISAMAFTKFYDIDTSLTRRFDAYLEDGVLCVDLKTAGLPVGGTRTRTRPRP
jgi:hypothetical protein